MKYYLLSKTYLHMPCLKLQPILTPSPPISCSILFHDTYHLLTNIIYLFIMFIVWGEGSPPPHTEQRLKMEGSEAGGIGRVRTKCKLGKYICTP